MHAVARQSSTVRKPLARALTVPGTFPGGCGEAAPGQRPEETLLDRACTKVAGEATRSWRSPLEGRTACSVHARAIPSAAATAVMRGIRGADGNARPPHNLRSTPVFRSEGHKTLEPNNVLYSAILCSNYDFLANIKNKHHHLKYNNAQI